MRAGLLLILCLAAGFLLAAGRPARAEQTKIDSDKLAIQGDVYTFTGNVRMERDGIKASSDNAEYSLETKDLHLVGTVYFEDKEMLVHADEAFIDLEDNTGIIYSGNILFKKYNMHVRASEIERVSEDKYTLKDACMTTCNAEVPAWAIAGRDVNIKYGEYVRSSGTRFLVKDVPVLYSPYFQGPFVVDRKSGFLTPSVGYSTFLGGHLELPYYWAISDNNDATFTTEVYSSRAAGMIFQGRYLEPSGIQGQQNVELLRDWAAKNDYVVWSGFQSGPYHFFDAQFASHNDFYRLYSLDYQVRTNRFLETKGEVYKDWEPGKLFVDARAFEDLADGADQKTVFQRLPEVGYSLYPRPLGPFVLNLDSTYVNFWRDEGQTAERVQATPRLTLAVGSTVTFTQTGSLSARSYSFQNPSESMQAYVGDYEAALRTRLERQYPNGITHYIEPTLTYSNKAVYGTPPPIVLDSLEYDANTSLLGLDILNRFRYKKSDIVTFEITTAYDLNNPGRPIQPIGLSIAMNKPISVSGTLSYEPYTSSIQSGQIIATVPWKKLIFSVDEIYEQNPTAYVHRLGVSYNVSSRLAFEGNAQYDTSQGGLQDFRTMVVYKGQCWSLRFAVTRKHNPSDLAFLFKLQLSGLGESTPS